MLTIKQVSSHGQSQRLAKTLGFHTTGLLLDYVASPFGQPQPESIVLGRLPLRSRPIPALNWPAAWREWLTPLSRAFGSVPPPAQGPGGGLSIASHGRRLEVGMEEISGGRLREVAALPAGRLVYVRLALGPDARARRPHCNRPASFAAAWCPARTAAGRRCCCADTAGRNWR